MSINIQFNKPHADTMTRMTFFLVGENRRYTSLRSQLVEIKGVSSEGMKSLAQ